MAEIVKSSATLFNNPILSDVKIKQVYNGKTREYYAHKATLCGQSDYFMNTFTGNFKEATAKEMELYDDDPDHFEVALKFIYTVEYDKSAIGTMAGDDKIRRVLIPMGIYTIADKYEITRLRSPVCDDVVATLHSTSDHNFEILRTVITAYYDSEHGCSADTRMGRLITSFLLEHRRDFLKSNDFDNIMEKFPWFAVDIVLESKRQGVFNIQKASCPESGYTGRVRVRQPLGQK